MENQTSKLYDRQIQIFGAETQKRISSTEIYICGLTTVTVEIVKNLALIGFNIALSDQRPLTQDCITSLPLLGVCDESHIGQCLDETIKEKLQEMNPHIKVRVIEGTLKADTPECPDVLIAKVQNAETALTLSAQLKELDMPKFYLFESGWSFIAVAELPGKPFSLSSHNVKSFQEALATQFGITTSLNTQKSQLSESYVLGCVSGATFNQMLLTLVSRQNLDYNLLHLAFNQDSENPSDHRKLDCLLLN